MFLPSLHVRNPRPEAARPAQRRPGFSGNRGGAETSIAGEGERQGRGHYRSIGRFSGIERVAQPDPEPSRRAERTELFGNWIDTHCRSERAVRARECIGTEQTEIRVATVQEIRGRSKKLQLRARLEARIEIDHGVGRYPAVTVAIVLVAVRVLAGRIDRACADGPARSEVEVEAQFQGIRGCARNAIARADRDRSVLVGGRVVRACGREWRAEPGVDVAVTNTRRELAEAPACRQLDALTTRLPDILEEAGIERALAGGDELDVVVEIGAIEGSRP